MLRKRILFPVSNKSADSYYFTEGLAFAYADTHEVLVIGIEQKPLFDLFVEWKPDIVFVHEVDYDDVFVRCLAKHPTVAIVLTHTREGRLKNEANTLNIDAFGSIANTHKYRRNEAIEKTVDVSYISEYDQSQPDKLPFDLSNRDLVFQIFSNNPWPLTQWIGTLNGNEAYIYNRSKIVITDNILDRENINACGAYFMETNTFDGDEVLRMLEGYKHSHLPNCSHTYIDVVNEVNKKLSKLIEL